MNTRRPLALALTLTLLLLGVPTWSAAAEEPGQVIDENQQQGSGRVVLSAGHVDFGPTFGTGDWALQIHDDTATPRYWRNPEDVVLRVTDAAILTVPEDEDFAFLRLPAGTSVHVVPQVEQPGVIWAGWNTQEPTVLDQLNLGATLRIHAMEGPGEVTAYLQGGNFAAPQVLWTTHEPFPQEAWIEVNTHTHANWVFSEPGVYLVDAEFTGDLVTGETMSARGTLRLAVGDATDPQDAFDAALPGPASAESGEEADASGRSTDESAEQGTHQSTDPQDAGGTLPWYLIAAGGAVLLLLVVIVSLSSARARRQGRAAASGDDS